MQSETHQARLAAIQELLSVLRWMAGNVAIEQDAADNWKPSKKKSQERIDRIVALVMGIDLATRHVEHESIYSKRVMLFL